MEKIKLCCFTANTTHACIIANNYIEKNLNDVKVIYINEKNENTKMEDIIYKFYNKLEDKVYYTDSLNEKILNDYVNERFVFVVHGKEKFVNKVNEFLDINKFNGYIINCFDVYDINGDILDIVSKHDHYINTTGIVERIN